MTAKRDLKRLVRQRASKTGESYTAALRHFLPALTEEDVQPSDPQPSRFDKFTPAARTALIYAQQEANQRGHAMAGPEHLLLALTRQPASSAGRALERAGVAPGRIREAAELLLANSQPNDEPGMARVRRVFEGAIASASAHGHESVGTAHLLMGCIDELGWAGQAPPAGIDAAALRLAALSESAGDDVAVSPVFEVSPEGIRLKPGSVPGRVVREAPIWPEPDIDQDALIARLTDTSKVVLLRAEEESNRFQHNYIGTEHLLLGLALVPDSSASRVLERLGVQLSQVQSSIEFIIGRGPRQTGARPGLTPRAHKALRLAAGAADELGQQGIDAGHILLGLAREGAGIAAGVLESLGISMQRIGAELEAELGTPPGGWRPVWPSAAGGLPTGLTAVVSTAEPSLGGLQRVVSVGQTLDGLALLSLELYRDGFLAILRLISQAGSFAFPNLKVTAAAARGRARTGLLSSRSGSAVAGGYEYRFIYAFAPTLLPTVRSLTIAVESTNPTNIGPWKFSVQLDQPAPRAKRS